jgi:hypothetical protein
MIGRRTTATDLPQTVAALHSVVGLAAVMTSFGSVMAHIGGADISTLHMVAGYLGVLIGKLPFRPSRSYTNPFRWCNLHWLGCGFPQAGRSHVLKANQNPRSTTLPQLFPSWSECCYHGHFPRYGSWFTNHCCCVPEWKCDPQFLEGLYYHGCYWWC